MQPLYLKTEAEWEQAIARVDELIALGFVADPARQAEVARLADAIQEFEQRNGWAPQTRVTAAAR